MTYTNQQLLEKKEKLERLLEMKINIKNAVEKSLKEFEEGIMKNIQEMEIENYGLEIEVLQETIENINSELKKEAE